MAANWQCDNCGSVVFSGSPGPCMDCGGDDFHLMTDDEVRASMEEAGVILDDQTFVSEARMKPPVVRRLPLPNGDEIVSLREDVLQAGITAANTELRRIAETHHHCMCRDCAPGGCGHTGAGHCATCADA